MTWPHWVGYRTDELASGELCLVGRSFYAYPVAALIALVGFGLPAVLMIPDVAATSNARPVELVMPIFLLICVCTAGTVYLLWFFSVERTVRFSAKGDLTITDRMVLRSTFKQLPLRDVRKFRVFTFYPTKSLFKLMVITADLASGDALPIVTRDAQMYSWQGRQAREALERFLDRRGMKIPVEGT